MVIATQKSSQEGGSNYVAKESEVQLSLGEAHSGQVTAWNSVGDYFKWIKLMPSR